MRLRVKAALTILGVLLWWTVLFASSTAVNLSDTNRTSGIAPVVRAGTGAATTSANFALAGPTSGGAAAYSFKAYPSAAFAGLPNVATGAIGRCSATGTSMTCIGDAEDSSGADTTATSTLPSLNTATSDTTGAGCGTPFGGSSTNWYSGRNLTFTAFTRIDSTTGIRGYWGLVNGANTFCATETNIANAIAVFRFSSTTPDINFMGQVTDAVGTNVVTCDTGVPGDTDMHNFKIFFDNANSQVSFFVNDMKTPGCSINSNFDATLNYHWLFMAYCNTCLTVAKRVSVSQFDNQTTPH